MAFPLTAAGCSRRKDADGADGGQPGVVRESAAAVGRTTGEVLRSLSWYANPRPLWAATTGVRVRTEG